MNNYLKLKNGKNVIFQSISKKTQSFNNINGLNRISYTNNSNNSDYNNSNNKDQKRNFSSFNIKEDQENNQNKKRFGFKTILLLGFLISSGSYIYYLRDNEDAVFSTKLPYQKEEVERFKILMRELKKKREDAAAATIPHDFNQKNEEVKEVKEVKEEPIIVKEEIKEVKEEPVVEKEEVKQVEEEKKEPNNDDSDNEGNNGKSSGYGFSSSDSYDEINSEEADLDNTAQEEENENINVVEGLVKSINDGSDDGINESATQEFLSVVNEEIKEYEENENKLEINDNNNNNNNKNSNEFITIIEDKKGNDEIIKIKEEIDSTKKEIKELFEPENIVTEIIKDVLSIIPINLTGKEKVEDVIKMLDSEYKEMVKSLIEENDKLKNQLGDYETHKKEYLDKFEQYIKDKYKIALDATVDLLHGDIGEKLIEMDKYVKENLESNKKEIQESIDRQKENLISIFEKQSEAIKKSELEKRAVAQLTQLILDIEKLLKNEQEKANQSTILSRSYKNFKELSEYDKLIKELLESLPKQYFEESNKAIVMEFDKLLKEFKNVSKEVRKISLVNNNDNTYLGKIVSFLGSQLIIPKSGMVTGDTPDAILSRVEEYLRRNDLTNAIKEMESLVHLNDDQFSKLTESWLKQAKERDQLENVAKVLQLKLELIQKQQLEQQQQKSKLENQENQENQEN